MNQQQQDNARADVLALVSSIIDLSIMPERFERVRRYVMSRPITEATKLQIAAEALREAGVMASIRTTPDGPVIDVGGEYHSFLSVTESLPPIKGTEYKKDKVAKFKDVWPYISRFISNEKRDIWYVIVYGILSSLLGLVIPLSSQSIVNSVALGVFNRQLVVLCAVVFVAMVLTAGIAVLEQYVVDVMQRRLFVRTAFDVVSRLPQMQRARNVTTYTPELVNRFFDVMTVQKSIAKFLLEGVRSILMLFVGLVLLALYHPFFLVYDLLFVLFIPVLVFVLGRRAIDTAVVVSKRKYQAAAWIEDVARNQQSFKLANAMGFAYDRIDSIGGKYVDAKHRHFIILARQILGTTLFKAFATVGVLGLGGILVIEQQISLGQLVAAEIIIIMILGAIEKILGEFDTYYDFIAALDKLAVIAEQPLEPIGGMKLDVTGPLTVELDNVSLTLGPRKVLQGASTHVPAGGRLSLVGQSGSGKSTILNLISGIYEADQGTVRINGRDVRELDVQDLRQYIGYVLPEDSIVEGTVRENILLGRDLPDEQLEWALAMTHLQRDVRVLPHGMETMLYSGGDAISYGMRRRILLARVIVHQPRLLLIDEAFDGIEDAMKLAIIQELVSWKGWTVINVSHDPELVRITPQVCVLSDGVIKEHGTPQELAATTDSIFATLFPLPSVFDVRNDDRQEGRHA